MRRPRKPSRNYPNGFYVYRLIDPRDQRAFYVGKGQGDRAWQHEREVRSDRPSHNAAKCRRIASILAEGLSVQIDIVDEFESEADALACEWELVDADPTLTNVMPGGIGRAESPEARTRRLLARKRLINWIRRREYKARLKRDEEARTKLFHSIPGAERHRAEIDAWLNELHAPGRTVKLNTTKVSRRERHQQYMRQREMQAAKNANGGI